MLKPLRKTEPERESARRTLPPLAPIRAGSEARILDFDIENRPLNYAGRDYTQGDITAIAWSWYGEDEVEVETLRPYPYDYSTRLSMLARFAAAYDRADMVTGHYVRGHDLASISGALVEMGMYPLGPKLVSDTYTDLKRLKTISKSQENLSEMFGIPNPKVHMSQAAWREANRLTPEGIALAVERVTGDVRQHKALRAALIERDLLKAPRMWRP